MGELAAGRRIGNRAMLWGAVAGTIPDLDIAAGWVADPITSLAFHRCVTHSLYYALFASPVLAWMVRALYGRGGRPEPGYLWRVWLPATVVLYVLLVAGSLASPTPLEGVPVYSAVVAGLTVVVPFLVWALRSVKARGNKTLHQRSTVTYVHWLSLFLLGIGTHPLLDCFTTYGTQVFQPFSQLRVAWNTVSVVDPAYTLPFLICLLVASRALRESRFRRRITWLGVGLSTAYLMVTCVNLLRMRSRVASDLAAADIAYERFVVTPTLFQNVLWNVAIDQGDTMLIGQLGLLDDPFRLSPKRLRAFPQNRQLLAPLTDERGVEVARWFSDGYYIVERGQGDTLGISDLRFGVLPTEGASPLFGFQLYPRGEGEEYGFRQKPFRDEVDIGETLGQLWDRVKGGEMEGVLEEL